MRLEGFRIHGLGPFAGEFAVDFADYPDARIIAVTGHNGAGKSTALECALPGALYRSTPTRGSLTSLATCRDAFVESRVVNGRSWTIRHMVDAVSGKGESLVLDEDGAPATASGKVRDFDSFAASHFPPENLLLASVFGAQGSSGFLGMKRAERIDVILRAVGADHLEQLAKAAREHARDAKAEAKALADRIADERARAGDVAELEAELLRVEARAAEADNALDAARSAVADAEKAEAERAERARRNEVVRERRRELAEGHAAAVERVADLERRLANNRAVLAEAEQIRAAVARLAGLQEEQRAAIAEVQRLEAVAVSEQRQRDHEQAEADRAGKRAADTRARRDRIRSRMPDRAAVEKAGGQLEDLAAHADNALQAARRAQQSLDELRKTRLSGAEDRIAALRSVLEEIAAGDEDDPADAATEVLGEDDEAQRAAAELPAQLSTAEAALRAAQDRAGVAERALVDAQQLAARMADLEAAEAEIAEAGREASAAADARQVHERAAGEAELQIAKLLEQQAAAGAQQHAAGAAIAELAPIAVKADPLARAEARLAELAPQHEAAVADRDRLDAELRATPEPVDLPSSPAPGVAPLRQRLAEAENAARAAHGQVGATTSQLAAARESSARLEQLERELAAVHDDLADWQRLSDELGRDGLQSAEVDCAGPELTELVNDLLRTCHGPRWTVRVDTQRLDSTGRRLLDGCDVNVLDTVAGREGEGSTFSGGERAFLSEALALALAMLSCRRSGMDAPTLVRDETGAALDPENARSYVRMLRRAAELVGASRVLVVSHSEEIQEMCDAKIRVGVPSQKPAFPRHFRAIFANTFAPGAGRGAISE